MLCGVCIWQHTATHYNTLQLRGAWILQDTASRRYYAKVDIATHCNTLQLHRNTLQHTATHCNYIATHCNYVQCRYCTNTATVWSVDIATHCNTLQHTATHCKILQPCAKRYMATHYNSLQLCRTWTPHTLQHTDRSMHAMLIILQHTATHCNTLQHTATHCNTLQHTATHRNTLTDGCMPC